ncbi:MAG: helix-turn-helix transcriptional regulator [Clostridia bacterium]|nr:helix-turn-helix transcriptional regulator [Clostridia bacterium]MBQ9323542.1 helix-turn-helix transcriptional regulator [Clostridia bacterium]
MILADKIIDLRKKAGWSQEELAEKLDVSRQSVSKWEGAQSIPDMNKILQLSELFGVSTDYLLKDSMEAAETVPSQDTDAEDATFVSMEEANAFLSYKAESAPRIALGVLLCILSPIALILLGGAQESGRLAITEMQAAMIGLIVLLLMVAGAVLLFVLTGMKGSKFEYLEKNALDTAYGVSGMVRERMQREESDHTRSIAVGVVLCVLAAIPLFVLLLWRGEDEFYGVLGVSAILTLAGIGVHILVKASIPWEGYRMLLEEGDYTRDRKRTNRQYAGIYWCIVTAAYLAVSFLTNRWDMTWIIWPVAAVLFGAVGEIGKLRGK